MQTWVKELGVDLVVLYADKKLYQVFRSLEGLVAQKVDGIIFTPFWATAAQGVKLAQKRISRSY